VSVDAFDERMKLAEAARSMPRPDLRAVTTPALTAALEDDDHLWAFVVAPATPYLVRRAAGVQGARVFSLARLGRLMAAIGELRAEERQSEWGLGMDPRASYPIHSKTARRAPGATVTVLGIPWTVPDLRDAPLTWEEEAAAPWPWQVQQTLTDLFRGVLPDETFSRSPGRVDAWFLACLSLPTSTDADALLFVEATQPPQQKSPAILARWRSIALAPGLPEAAEAVARNVGEATRRWDAPMSAAIGHVILLDILQSSPHAPARERAAYGVKDLSRRWHDGREEVLPPPATAILWLLEAAMDPKNGDASSRLYVYGLRALEAMPAPPFPPDRPIDAHGPEPAARLAELADWFRGNKPRLAAEAAREAPALAEARALLVKAARATDAP
jgi:hypothetical protein